MMSKIIRFIIFIILTSCSISCFCNKRKSFEYVLDVLKYDTVKIVYPKSDAPWEYYGSGVLPHQYTTHYSRDLRIMKTTDTTLIRNLINMIDRMNAIDYSNGIDTWIMVLLHNSRNNGIDTLTIGKNYNWFNRTVYKDSSVCQIIIDEIVKYDRDFAKLINDYYVDGKWLDCAEVALKKQSATK